MSIITFFKNTLDTIIKDIPPKDGQELIKTFLLKTNSLHEKQTRLEFKNLPPQRNTVCFSFTSLNAKKSFLLIRVENILKQGPEIHYILQDFQKEETLKKTLIRLQKALIFQEKIEKKLRPIFSVSLIDYLLKNNNLKDFDTTTLLESSICLKRNYENKTLSLCFSKQKNPILLEKHAEKLKRLYRNLRYKIKGKYYSIQIFNRFKNENSKIISLSPIKNARFKTALHLTDTKIENFHALTSLVLKNKELCSKIRFPKS